MQPLLALVGGYLIGSISFALLLSKARGVDLRSIGSGNLGATNVSRALGARAGVLVFLLDASKGAIPMLILTALGAEERVIVATGLGAYLGHIWPLYLKFRGGKGVATLIGCLLAGIPWTALLVAPFALGALFLTRIMAVGSLTLGAGLPIASYLREDSADWFAFASFAGVFLFWTHRANLRRILTGQENRLGRSKRQPPTDGRQVD